ncbi:hypothetical protein B296_00055267 [Ensete ventricosum]|uniref:Uncharacterized protein n=1 Tax=Ensete ventricosum TaxID=4639 RepID=A0A426Y0H2_ENSVE|nr:hypothetical protein B296_00055267 [Ensete ventricosum]
MIRAARELDCSRAYIRLRESGKSEDKTECVEAGGRKGQGCDDKFRGAQLPRKLSVGENEGGIRGVPQCRRGGSTDREERDADARQPIVVPWAWQRLVP